ncbi:MAG: cell division protein FtsX [Bacteroidetes bacterium]|nr:MAG: cell division protein FtsX [Bacteroidota bacterium]
MAQHEEKYNRRRLRSAHISTVISITLVLFLLGILGTLIIHAETIVRYAKEHIIITLTIKNETDPGKTLAFKRQLEATPYIRSATFISKEEAAKDLQEELGEDFIAFLGYNPLPTTLDLYPSVDYAHPDSLQMLAETFKKDPIIAEVKYQRSLVGKIQDNIEKITLVILGFSALLLLISIILIHNTIRLSIYAGRFLIRTMYLIGATRRFIRRPFIKTGILQGVASSLLSLILITLLLTEVYNRFPEAWETGNRYHLLYLAAIIVLVGLMITVISTVIAVNKYLNAQKEKLYD